MQNFNGKTAVITGAGSGFGREFALRCAELDMRLVLADVDQAALAETASLLGDTPVHIQPCDVAKADEVEALAQAADDHFGGTHLLFNNAGIGVSGPSWTASLAEWKWVLEVNLMGVVHGVHSFVPRMLEAKQPCHIVNTASAAGLTSVPGSSVYCVSKHAVVTLSECLYQEMQMLQSEVGVSVLCPAFVKTRIADADRLRPENVDKNPHPFTQKMDAMLQHAVNSGRLSAKEIAEKTLQAVADNQFYILPHPGIKTSIAGRMQHILDDQPPHNPLTEKP